MPYITAPRRTDLVEDHVQPANSGELNYAVSKLIDDYVGEHGLNYSVINDIMGALGGAAEEFYRRVAAPYEDIKRNTNGEVFVNSTRLLARA